MARRAREFIRKTKNEKTPTPTPPRTIKKTAKVVPIASASSSVKPMDKKRKIRR